MKLNTTDYTRVSRIHELIDSTANQDISYWIHKSWFNNDGVNENVVESFRKGS